MTKDELILIDKAKVRRDSNLMSIYIDLFSKEFGKKPNCASCTFSNDWIRFVNSVKSDKKSLKLKSVGIGTTFELKQKSAEIWAYRKDGKTFRTYSNKMIEHFAIEFLTNGTEAELSERKKLFKKLPVALSNKPLNAEQAIELVKNEDSVEVLNEMLLTEERKTVKSAIKKRIKELTKK